MVGHMTGALAQMCTVLATLLGGLTASSSADAAMLAKILGPEMVKSNYSPAFAAVITSCAAIITALIPPSIGLIIYGYIADVSIGRLFIGGVVPGLLLAASLMIVTWLIAQQARLPAGADRISPALPELGRTFRDALWALSIPVFIIVGIRYGIFTPTEAGAITVLYTILVGRFAYRASGIRRPAARDEGDGARHQFGHADDLRRLRVRLLPRLGADPAADGGLARVADEGADAAAAPDQRAPDRARHCCRGNVGADYPHADLRADPDEARHRSRSTSVSFSSPT